ncbi:hypothetical protein T492DRAFT_1047707 [Pavlovales sp. CCMP2436]|nr:hypothetical protein T492DRAFT_1047707 [Pavlovales sp. CCMP2436]
MARSSGAESVPCAGARLSSLYPAEPAMRVPVEPAPRVPSEPAPRVPSNLAPRVPSEPARRVPSEPALCVSSEPAPCVPSEPAPSKPCERRCSAQRCWMFAYSSFCGPSRTRLSRGVPGLAASCSMAAVDRYTAGKPTYLFIFSIF